MKKGQKINITLTVDIEKKHLFEILSHFHEKTFSDALDIGIDSVLEKTSNEEFLKLKIKETENELDNLKNSLDEIRIIRESKLKKLNK
jgi:hypothetical protein